MNVSDGGREWRGANHVALIVSGGRIRGAIESASTTLARMPEVQAPRKSGPAPGATRDEVLALARAHFLDCRRVDVQAIAAECGVGRATVYRWFGSREGLLAEAMLGIFERRVADARAAVGGRGSEALLDTLDLVYRGLASEPHVRAFIERERGTALPLMTSSQGQVHPRIVELVQGLIEAEVERGDYRAPSDPATLAYVLVRLAEALLFNYAADDVPKDIERMREVVAALLGALPRGTG
jgi:AcrR family transcriptional regulator